MRRHPRIRNVIGALVVLAIAGLALYVGGGWGIVVLEGAGALVLVVLFLRSTNEGGNDDAAG